MIFWSFHIIPPHFIICHLLASNLTALFSPEMFGFKPPPTNPDIDPLPHTLKSMYMYSSYEYDFFAFYPRNFPPPIGSGPGFRAAGGVPPRKTRKPRKNPENPIE